MDRAWVDSAWASLGVVLALVSMPLVVVLPEVGVPVLLVGLRLMARRFAWAARASAAVQRRYERLRQWLRALPWRARLALLAVAVSVAGTVVAVLARLH